MPDYPVVYVVFLKKDIPNFVHFLFKTLNKVSMVCFSARMDPVAYENFMILFEKLLLNILVIESLVAVDPD